MYSKIDNALTWQNWKEKVTKLPCVDIVVESFFIILLHVHTYNCMHYGSLPFHLNQNDVQ